MLTVVEGQGTTARNMYGSGALTASCGAKYVSDTNGTGICIINGDGLLANKLVCEDPYCLDAGSWQSYEPKISLDETFANQIAEEVAKKLNKQIDPLEKNAEVDEVEIPPMSGFVEI